MFLVKIYSLILRVLGYDEDVERPADHGAEGEGGSFQI